MSNTHADTFYTDNASLKADFEQWKALTVRLTRGLTALASHDKEIDSLRNEVEKYRKQKDSAVKQNEKAAKNQTLLTVNVSAIDEKIADAEAALIAKTNLYADILSPEDRENTTTKRRDLSSYLLKEVDTEGKSASTDAKEFQKAIKNSKTFYALLQQARKETGGKRKSSSWWPFGADGNFDSDEQVEGYYLATAVGYRV